MPPVAFLGCTMAVLLFVAGWLGCASAVLRALGGRSLELALAGGFAGWCACLVTTALLLPILGVFHAALFIALPLAVASIGVVSVSRSYWTRSKLPGGYESAFIATGISAVGAVAVAASWINMTYPFPGWDAISYHQPISLLFLQEGRFHDLPGMYQHINTFPKSGELIGAWMLAIAGWTPVLNLVAPLAWLASVAATMSLLRNLRATPGESLWLAISSIGTPAVMLALTREASNVDVLFGTMLVIAIAGMVDYCKSSDRSPASLAVCLVALGLSPGIKASGVFVGGAIGLILVGVLVIQRASSARISFVLIAGFTITLLISGYWLVTNHVRYGNPIHPISLTFGGSTIIEGEQSLEQYIGSAPELEGRTGWSALMTSIRQTDLRPYLWGGRVGAWGWIFCYATLPLWFVGLVVAAWRRHWDLAGLLLLMAILLVATPSSWWARYSLAIIFLAPIIVVPLLREINVRWRRAVVTVWGMASLISLAHAAMLTWENWPWEVMRTNARNSDRGYCIPQDATPYLPRHRHGIYRWASESLPAGSTLIYDLGEGGDHLAMLFRPDAANIVRNLEWPQTIEPADFLLISTREMEDYAKAMNGAATPEAERFAWGGQLWSIAYLDAHFIAFRREVPPARAE